MLSLAVFGPRASRAAVACLSVCALSACASTASRNLVDVSEELQERTGSALRLEPEDVAPPLPESVELADGITRAEAIEIGLWNNPQFRADLVEMGFARADLEQAGVLRNPLFSILFPLGPKQLEATLLWPLQDLWQRPRRVAVARLSAERMADRLIENGLDLVERIKIAYADLIAARANAEIAGEGSAGLRRLSELAEARLRAGDISPLERTRAQVRFLQAEDESHRLEREAIAAEQRLLAILDLDAERLAAGIRPETDQLGLVDQDNAALVAQALAARPDVRAAELGIEWAGERIGLERANAWKVAAIADANGAGLEGFEAGPGLQIEIPLFDRNQGNISKARAEFEHAVRRYAAVRNQVELEVRQACVQYGAARDSLRMWRDEIVPSLRRAGDGAERAFEAGEVSLIEVYEAKVAHLAGRRRQNDLRAETARALARLENAVGRELESP